MSAVLQQDYFTKVGLQGKRPVRYLAVYCSDPFYHRAFEEFLSNLGEAFVAFAEPGGPLLVQEDWYTPEDQGSILGRMHHLIRELGVEEVVFISHSSCAAYAAKYRDASLSKEEIDGFALDDLRQIKSNFPALFPEIKKVHAFFASPAGERIQFMLI